MVRDSVRTFIQREIVPLEPQVLRNEREGRPALETGQLRQLQDRAKAAGFWGVVTPEEFGGANLGAVINSIVLMEVGRTFVPFTFGGWADNILFACNEEQKQEYLIPTLNGDRISCFALTEPGAGSDATQIRARAVRDGSDWIISGEKVFITAGHQADFAMVFAVTDSA